MIKRSRTMIITALLAAAVAWVGSADAQMDSAHAAKMSAVRDYLGDASTNADWSTLAEECKRAAALESISLNADADGMTLSLELTEAVPYLVSFDAAAQTLAIDLAGAIAVPNMRSLVLNTGAEVGPVNAGVAAIRPAIVSRAVVDVMSPVAVSANYSGNTLVVRADSSASFEYNGNAESRAEFFNSVVSRADGQIEFTRASEKCAEAVSALQRSLADAKLALLERQFAGIGTEGAAAGSTKELEGQIDALAVEAERFAAAQQRVLSDREAARDNLVSALQDGDVVRALEEFQKSERVAMERLNNIASAVDVHQRDAATVYQSARSLATTSTPGSAGGVFEALDGAFSELRADASAPTSLENLDAAMTEVAAVDVELALEPTPMAAVKSSDTSALTALSDAPAKRPASDFNSTTAVVPSALGEISVMYTGEEPVRLAQSTSRSDISFTAPRGATYQLRRAGVPPEQDPLQQPVTIDFRDMDLLNVVSLLAEKGEINVIAGTEVRGTVTASLQDIPLGRAIEIILRMNGLGIVEEAGVYRITTYEEAVESQRETRIIFLQNTVAEDIEDTIRQAVRGPQAASFQASSNEETNTIVLSGPADLVNQMAAVVEKLDVTEQAIPTVTRVFRLNHAIPTEIEQIIDDILTDEGDVNSDLRSRQLVVTDTPGKIAEIEELVTKLDEPVKQVAIEATVVDVVLRDDVRTGVDWVLSRTGLPEGRLTALSAASGFALPTSATATLGVLSGDFDLDLMLFGEVENGNAEILANPVVVTVENSPAEITIADEIPYREQTQTAEGGLLTSTAFKEIGTTLEVTPRITYDNEIVVALAVEQSSVSGEFDGIPIEAERQVLTTLRLDDGQTVFIGGLRKFQDSLDQQKMPILGNIPVVGVLFGNRSVSQDNMELLVFLTCNVLANDLPELTPYQQEMYDEVGGREMRPTGERTMVESYIHPEIYRDPFYKWRRDK